MGATMSSHFGYKSGFLESENMQHNARFEAIGAPHMEVKAQFFPLRWSTLLMD